MGNVKVANASQGRRRRFGFVDRGGERGREGAKKGLDDDEGKQGRKWCEDEG